MIDFSEDEIGAISAVFPACQSYLCDFHREQSWEQWTIEQKHGLFLENAEIQLSLLRDYAHAPSLTTADLLVDHYYQQQVDNLKKSRI